MKKLILASAMATLLTVGNAQNVFTYGTHAVSKEEFVRAFNKNPEAGADRKKALAEYLSLYTNFKLKVQAALDEKLDKESTQQYELENFKRQIAENIINDQVNVKALVKEAFDRSQKEIHLAQVFVEVPEGVDTTEAYKKIQDAYKALQSGKDFSSVAAEFSSDEYTRKSNGDLGYITAFTLGYQFENQAYALKPGNFSAPFRSKLGYHIFKNQGERKSIGTRKVAQILIAFPPNASDAEKAAAERKADSIYQLIQGGRDFTELVRNVSNDMSSIANNGILPEFGTGQYAADFENAAFSLEKAGEIAKPFATKYGYHILKLVEAKKPGTDFSDAIVYASLQEKVINDKRLADAKKRFLDKQLAIIKYKPAVYSQANLFAFTDTALSHTEPAPVKGITAKTLLFSFEKQNYTAGDWAKFVKASRNSSELSGKDHAQLLKEFLRVSADEYYRNHLEDYSNEYKNQVQEFKEANLLFGIMDKKVWNKANEDTAALKKYYAANKSKYTWGPSADAIIITAPNEKQANEIKEKLQKDINEWRNVATEYTSGVAADSSRYELGQLPVVDRTAFTPGLITAFVRHPNDGSVSFNYIIKTYPDGDQRSFDDARGLVISDYQQVLEDKWIESLKKKYPVKVNSTVFNTIK